MTDQYSVYSVYLLIAVLVTSVLCIYETTFSVGRAAKSGLWHVPGPSLARVTGLYRVFLLWSGECPLKIEKLHKQYGPIVRTGPKHVIVSDPSALFTIYGGGWRFPKTEFYRVFALNYNGETRDTVFSTRDAEYHKMMHSHVAGRFSASSLQSCETSIDECTNAFIVRMRQLNGLDIDFAEWAKYWAFDVNSAFEFRQTFGFLAKAGDIKGIIEGVEKGFHYGAIIGQMPWLNSWFFENKVLMKFLARFANVPDPTTDIVQLIEDRMMSFDSDPAQQGNCLLTWLRNEQENTRKKIDHTNMVIHLANYFVAGSITVATSIGAILYHTIKHPAAYERLVAEIRSAPDEALVPKPVTYAQILGLSYLQAVMKEAMRLSPTNNIPLERFVPAEGLEINGYHLPTGTNIGMSAQIIHRNRDIYGTDADDFRPERWLEADAATSRQMQQHFFAFGKGERGCSGRTLAMMMMGKFVAQVLREFDVVWAGQSDTWDLKTYWMPEQRGLTVKFRSRWV